MSNTQSLLVGVNYYFKGGIWPKILKDIARKDFTIIRNKWAKIFNDNIASINNQWNELYPDADLVNDKSMFDKYNRYVVKKMTGIMSMFNIDTVLFHGGFTDDADFRLVFKPYKNMYVDYDLTVLN